MRIWAVDPALLCRQHLLGEHRELHAIWTVLTEGSTGYRNHPETRRWKGRLPALRRRHELLVAEMAGRGYRHRSPIPVPTAGGDAAQRVLLASPRKQIALLSAKPCPCPLGDRLV